MTMTCQYIMMIFASPPTLFGTIPETREIQKTIIIQPSIFIQSCHTPDITQPIPTTMDSQNTAITTSTTTDDVEMSQSQISDTQREPTLGSDAEDDDEQGRRVLAGRARLGSFWEIDGWNDGESESHAPVRVM